MASTAHAGFAVLPGFATFQGGGPLRRINAGSLQSSLFSSLKVYTKILDNPFHKPHPFIFNIGSVLIPGLIAFLLILVFAPFDVSTLEPSNRVIISFMFGLISSFGVLMIVGLLKWLTPGFMQEESWTLGKELTLILTVVFGICLLNFLVIRILGLSETPVPELLTLVVLYTLGIGIIPVAVLVLFEQYTHQRKKLQQAQRLTKQLRQQKTTKQDTESASSAPILFEDENGNVELRLQSNEVLFLNSDGNYVEVHYLNGDQNFQKKLIRNRLKNFESMLSEADFFRSHKSYIVNKMHIIRVEGNARNLELIIRGTDHRVPVSRSKSDVLSEFLKGR